MRLLLFSQFRVLRRLFKVIKGLNSSTSAPSNLSLTWPSLPAPTETGIGKGLSRAGGTKSERVQLLYKVVWANWWKGPLNWVTWVYLSMENSCELQSRGSLALIIQIFELYWSNFTSGSAFICSRCDQAKLLLSKVPQQGRTLDRTLTFALINDSVDE